MFKRILLPVDPARPFGAANEYAVDLAKRFGSTLTTTYIIDDQLLGPAAHEEAASSIDEALEWVGRDAMDDFARHHPDVECSKTLAYGHTATALFQMVLQTGADLVVLGGYHSRAQPHVWGSTVVDVVHHAERSTIVVRESSHLPRHGEAIVVPFDGSERPTAVLPRVCRFAKTLGARVDLVHVARLRDLESARAILENGAWLVREHGVEVETHVLQKTAWRSKARAVLQHAQDHAAPLVAVSRLGASSTHTGRSRTVSWLLAHSPLPVWVVRT